MPHSSSLWNKVNKEIAQAYLAAYEFNDGDTPSRDQIQRLHNDVYDDNSLPENAWFPNQLLNNSSDPDALWADFMANDGFGDLLDDSYHVANAAIGAWLAPYAAYGMVADPEELREQLDFAENLFSALAQLSYVDFQQIEMDYYDLPIVTELVSLIESDVAAGAAALERLADGIKRYLESTEDDAWTPAGHISRDVQDIIALHKEAMMNDRPVFDDPLVLDLNGDGLSLTALEGSAAYFDLRNAGVANRTGWVTGGDGLLVHDLNDNGRIDDASELFGDPTQSAFDDLRTLDSNSDGRITSADDDWDTLRVWIDADEDGITDDGELHTLGSLGITAFDLATAASGSFVNGNEIVETAGFTINGQNRTAAEVLFNIEPTDSVYSGDGDILWEALLLPSLRGYGLMADTPVAMSGDAGLLAAGQALMADATLADFGDFVAAFETYLYKWAGVENVDPDSRGAFGGGDSRKLGFIEHYTGIPFISITDSEDPQYAHSWQTLSQTFQYALQDMWVKFFIQAEPGLQQVLRYDLVTDSILIAEGVDAQALTATQPTASDEDIALYWALLGFAAPPETVAGMELKRFILEQIEATGADLEISHATHLNTAIGTDGNDASLSGYYARIPLTAVGGDGDDGFNAYGAMYAGMTIHAGAGDDIIYASGGPGLFVGGAGNDEIYAGSGDDIFVFSLGDGQDIIRGGGSDDADRLVLTSDIAVSDVSYARVANDLLITIGTLGDQIKYQDYFAGEYYAPQTMMYAADDVIFADGTVHAGDDVIAAAGQNAAGTSASETLYTTRFDDTIDALGGNDLVHASEGDDTVTGGAGNDTLFGGYNEGVNIFTAGEDTFIFREGDGRDKIINGGGDVVFFDDTSVSPANVVYARNGVSLVIFYGALGDSVEISNFFTSGMEAYHQISGVLFEDNTFHSASFIEAAANVAPGTFNGTSGNDVIAGSGGNDTLLGHDGDDVLMGGGGDDYLAGGAGSDTYWFAPGFGTSPKVQTVNVYEYRWDSGIDTIHIGGGLTADDVKMWMNSYGHMTVQVGDNPIDTFVISNGT